MSYLRQKALGERQEEFLSRWHPTSSRQEKRKFFLDVLPVNIGHFFNLPFNLFP